VRGREEKQERMERSTSMAMGRVERLTPPRFFSGVRGGRQWWGGVRGRGRRNRRRRRDGEGEEDSRWLAQQAGAAQVGDLAEEEIVRRAISF